jgi:hypothetical protein
MAMALKMHIWMLVSELLKRNYPGPSELNLLRWPEGQIQYIDKMKLDKH